MNNNVKLIIDHIEPILHNITHLTIIHSMGSRYFNYMTNLTNLQSLSLDVTHSYLSTALIYVSKIDTLRELSLSTHFIYNRRIMQYLLDSKLEKLILRPKGKIQNALGLQALTEISAIL